MGSVTRDLYNMFSQRRGSHLAETLYRNEDFQEITKRNYAKKLEKERENFLKSYEKTQTAIYNMGEFLASNEIIENLRITSSLAKKIIPTKFDDLLINLINAPSDILISNYERQLQNYEKSYNHFFDIMADNIEKLQSIGQTARDEIFYYHIGVEDKKQNLKIFQLDSKTMSQFERDKEFFKLDVSKAKNGTYNITFKTQDNLSGEDIIEGLTRAINNSNDKKHNLAYELTNDQQDVWHKLRTSNIYSSTNNKLVKGAGRRLEVFDKNLLAGTLDTLAEDLSNKKFKNEIYLDNLAWVAGGDISGKTASGQNVGIQNKMFGYNIWYDKTGKRQESYSGYGFNISSYDTILQAISSYQGVKKSIEKDNEGNYMFNEDSEFWKDTKGFESEEEAAQFEKDAEVGLTHATQDAVFAMLEDM